MESKLMDEIIEDLTSELKQEPQFNSDVLSKKVKNAIREVRMRRNYVATSFTEKQIISDLENFYSVIRNVALYDYNQVGAEFENSHSENSISRTWTDRSELFKSVHAFVKVL